MVRAVRTFRGRNVYVLCLLGIFALSVLVALSFLEFRSENRERIQAVNNAYLEEIARPVQSPYLHQDECRHCLYGHVRGAFFIG